MHFKNIHLIGVNYCAKDVVSKYLSGKTTIQHAYSTYRIKIMHNIGLVFVRMGQYSEACTSFEYIMQEEANFKTGLDLVTAYYALGDKERMKKGFLRLLECQLDIDDDEKYTATSVSVYSYKFYVYFQIILKMS